MADSTPTAQSYVPNCKTLRISAGKKIVDLATAAGVSRDTVSKIEKQQPVSPTSAHAVFNALNAWYKDGLKRSDEITSVRLTGRKKTL